MSLVTRKVHSINVINFTISVLVTLHSSFEFCQPLSVTGYWKESFKDTDDKVMEHQMIVEGVVNEEYVIQNTATARLLRIPLKNKLYIGDFNEWFINNTSGNYVIDHKMEVGQLHLGKIAFTVQIKLP